MAGMFLFRSWFWWYYSDNQNLNNNLGVRPVVTHSLVYVQLGKQKVAQSYCIFDSVSLLLLFWRLGKVRTSVTAILVVFNSFKKDRSVWGCFGPGWVKLWGWLPAQQWTKSSSRPASPDVTSLPFKSVSLGNNKLDPQKRTLGWDLHWCATSQQCDLVKMPDSV